MALRLILVGVVAGLGLNLPARESVQAWKHSAETWVYSCLAEWDARMPTDEKAFVVVAEPTAAPAEVPAPLPTPAPVAAATLVAFTPTEAELATGLDLPTIPMALEEPVVTPTEPVVIPTEPVVTSIDADFDHAMNAVVAELTADLRETEARSRLALESVIVGDGLHEGFAYALNRDADDWTRALETAEPVQSAPSVKPTKVGADLDGGVAVSLNREAESLGDEAATSEPTVSKSRLTQAVRLTGLAAQAWVNLLHGPAVVVITH
jgi:hypothetical protein